jgi:alpha-mannosidase
LAAIATIIERLRQLVQVDVQAGWREYTGEVASLPQDIEHFALATANEKGYLLWESGRKVRTLVQEFVVPGCLQEYPLAGLSLRLRLTWWAEDAEIFVNGKLVQAGDLFDSSARVLLTPQVTPGERFVVALRLVSPNHDIGALMRSQLLYEAAISSEIDPGFVADELAVVQKYWQAFEPEKLPLLAQAIEQIDWEVVTDAEQFTRSLSQMRQKLQPHAASLKQRCVKMLGHAHLDMAWLWEVAETWDVAQRTFESVLRLRRDFPDFTFCHTSPVLYEWIEKHRPDVFAAILEAVKGGWWDVVGGMWVEPDVNLPNGESLARQLLYGQRYTREKFGQIAKVGWLTDSFGFNWQLPQLLKQGGVEYFLTQKLHWNDSTEFPFGAFWWQSPDGTRIFTMMSPPNVTGVMDTNPMTVSDYTVKWEAQTQLQDSFWLPGVGDKGGGPSRDMLAVQQRWQQSPFFPRIEFTTSQQYLGAIQAQRVDFPVWKDELYLELHRGCYTAHADQKYFNRRCEAVLYQAELWSAIASLLAPQAIVQREIQQTLEKSWKQVLFNQFHDILPGTSIPGVFETANRDWLSSKATGEMLVQQALTAIAAKIKLPESPHPDAVPVVVFNALTWTRSQIVALPLEYQNGTICTAEKQHLPVQISADHQLLFWAANIPSVGYRVFWWLPSQPPTPQFSKSEFILENSALIVEIHPETGDIARIFDKNNQRDVLASPGNVLQAFTDQGQYWDAWNIDPNYEQHPLPPSQLQSIQWRDCGDVRQSIRVARQIGQSQFVQDYSLDRDSSVLQIATTVDWQERHVMVKAAFPFTVEADVATYEIPCGAIQRSTKPQTPAERAKWEVCALQWADLSNFDYGVSLLNDCKYGYDSKPNQLRLTLLRSPQWPHPDCDIGIHHFTYAVYPHSGSWQRAQTVRRGYELNHPLTLQTIPKSTATANLATAASFLNLDSETLILMALKFSEDDPNQLILRCYESCGEKAAIALSGALNLKLGQRVDLLERSLSVKDTAAIAPWQIASFRIEQ